MTPLISRFIVFTLVLLIVPASAFAKDMSGHRQSHTTFHTLKDVPKDSDSLPNPMTGRQLANVKGMISRCPDCTINIARNVNIKIMSSVKALLKKELQNKVQRSQSLTQQQAVTISKTLVDQSLNKTSRQQRLEQEILVSTQALVNQQVQQLPQGQRLAQEIMATTQALVNQTLSNLPPVPRMN